MEISFKVVLAYMKMIRSSFMFVRKTRPSVSTTDICIENVLFIASSQSWVY